MASSDSEGNVNEVPRKRGRPSKQQVLEAKELDEEPKIKRSPGRPKGSKNKTHKDKPVDESPKKARGRPRKWPPVEKPTGPKRKRGRPRKNPVPEENIEDVEAEQEDDEQDP